MGDIGCGSKGAMKALRPSHIILRLGWNSWHQVVGHFEGDDACHCLVNTRFGECAILQGLFDAVEHSDHLTRAIGAEQHIVARVQGQDSSLWHSSIYRRCLAYRGHPSEPRHQSRAACAGYRS